MLKNALLSRGAQLVFIRHGATSWHLDMLNEGPKDFGLNKFGLRNTMSMAKGFAGQLYSHTIYTSTLKRAIETAEIYSKVLNIDLTKVEGIQERYFGDYRLISKFNQALNKVPPDAESTQDFEKRVTEAFLNIIENHPDRSQIIIVSHGLVFEFIANVILGKKETLDFSDIAIFYPSAYGIRFQKNKSAIHQQLMAFQTYLDTQKQANLVEGKNERLREIAMPRYT